MRIDSPLILAAIYTLYRGIESSAATGWTRPLGRVHWDKHRRLTISDRGFDRPFDRAFDGAFSPTFLLFDGQVCSGVSYEINYRAAIRLISTGISTGVSTARVDTRAGVSTAEKTRDKHLSAPANAEATRGARPRD